MYFLIITFTCHSWLYVKIKMDLFLFIVVIWFVKLFLYTYFFRMMQKACTARSRLTGKEETENDLRWWNCTMWSLILLHLQVNLLGRRLRARLLHYRQQQLPHHPAALPTRPPHPPLWKYTCYTREWANMLCAGLISFNVAGFSILNVPQH